VQTPRSLREPEVFFSYVDVPPAAGEVTMIGVLGMFSHDNPDVRFRKDGTIQFTTDPNYPKGPVCLACNKEVKNGDLIACPHTSPSRPAGRG
jgi:hypothetical protein